MSDIKISMDEVKCVLLRDYNKDLDAYELSDVISSLVDDVVESCETIANESIEPKSSLPIGGVSVSVCDCKRHSSDRYKWEIKDNKCFVCGKIIEQTER